MTSARMRLERYASLPPRRMTELPVLRQRAAASTVTLGRASYTTAITPNGTRTLWISQTLGRPPSVDHLAHRVGQGRDVAQAAGYAAQALLVKKQAVDERRREAVLAPLGNVLGVLHQDLGRAALKRLSHSDQGPVLLGRRQAAPAAAMLSSPIAASSFVFKCSSRSASKPTPDSLYGWPRGKPGEASRPPWRSAAP